MQGHLRNESLSVAITSSCVHCARPIHLEIDSELNCRVAEEAAPIVSIPLVNFAKLTDPSIIHAF